MKELPIIRTKMSSLSSIAAHDDKKPCPREEQVTAIYLSILLAEITGAQITPVFGGGVEGIELIGGVGAML
jgi:hypothetical protein